MPLKKCKSEDKWGWKWGDSGKCYVGPDAKEKAIEQGRAMGYNWKLKVLVNTIKKMMNNGN